MQEMWIRSLGQKDHLEKEMATHPDILAWEIPWTEEAGRLQSMQPQNLATKQQQTYNQHALKSRALYEIFLMHFNPFNNPVDIDIMSI